MSKVNKNQNYKIIIKTERTYDGLFKTVKSK